MAISSHFLEVSLSALQYSAYSSHISKYADYRPTDPWPQSGYEKYFHMDQEIPAAVLGTQDQSGEADVKSRVASL